MIGREFVKRLRLLYGRSETIKTRFELQPGGKLVEHIEVETHDRPGGSAPARSIGESAAPPSKPIKSGR
jgi:hypothetical protein